MRLKFSLFIEIIVWLLIITLLTGFFIIFKNKHQNTKYHVFFEDINGLTIGSPVKFMGKQIGYVSELKIVDSFISVVFLVNSKIKLPPQCKANIEFYGIAGSKSLELFPPEVDFANKSQSFIANKTYRIENVYYNQMNLSLGILKMSSAISPLLTDDMIFTYKNILQNELDFKLYHKILDDIIKFENNIIIKLKKKK